MNGRMKTIRRRATVLAVAAIAVVALGGTALAGHIAGDVKSYTGCLAGGDGVIVKVREGDAPKSACTGGQTEVHLSGGDITKISVGGGLSLPNGGDNGEVTIELDAKYSLPQSCAAGEVAKWDGSTNEWKCAADSDTTYTAGTGLELNGTTFGIHSSYQVRNNQACASGQFTRAIDLNGNIQCAAPSTPTAYWDSANQPAYDFGAGIPDDGVFHVYASLQLPGPGMYLVTAKGSVISQQNVEENGAQARCQINTGNSVLLDNIRFLSDQLDDNWQTTFALSGVVIPTTNHVVQLACMAGDGADGLALLNGRILVIKVG